MGYFKDSEIDQNVRSAKTEECKHERVSKEVIYGSKTGDYVCDDCYTTFSSESLAELRSKK